MTDITERLERLARLRTAGMLSDAEFEQEKRMLLDTANLTTASTDDAEAPPQHSLLVRILALLGLIALCILMFAAIGWLQEAKEADERAEANTSSAQAQQWGDELSNVVDQAVAEVTQVGDGLARLQATGWSISAKRDPMTDLPVTTAATRIAAAPFMIEVSAICTADVTLEYRFTAFDEHGQPAPMRMAYMSGQPSTQFTFRVDNGEPESALNTLRYTNMAKLDSDARYAFITDAEHAARGARLTVALQLAAGEAVFTLNQSDPALRRMLDGCVQGLTSHRERLKAGTNAAP